MKTIISGVVDNYAVLIDEGKYGASVGAGGRENDY
jgi:hypothetical protein